MVVFRGAAEEMALVERLAFELEERTLTDVGADVDAFVALFEREARPVGRALLDAARRLLADEAARYDRPALIELAGDLAGTDGPRAPALLVRQWPVLADAPSGELREAGKRGFWLLGRWRLPAAIADRIARLDVDAASVDLSGEAVWRWRSIVEVTTTHFGIPDDTPLYDLVRRRVREPGPPLDRFLAHLLDARLPPDATFERSRRMSHGLRAFYARVGWLGSEDDRIRGLCAEAPNLDFVARRLLRLHPQAPVDELVREFDAQAGTTSLP